MTMVSVEQYDLIVIAGGMAGLPLSQKAALKGSNTALVERTSRWHLSKSRLHPDQDHDPLGENHAHVRASDGLADVDYLTNRSALELPESLIIVGGGYVGVEFAQMYARFGSRVTVLQRAERLVPNEELEISAVLMDVFQRERIDVVTKASVVGVKQSGGTFVVGARVGAELKTFQSTRLMLAAGRTPHRARVQRSRRVPKRESDWL